MVDITGDDNDNTLTGGAGNDKLDGRLGNDTLCGGAGNDELKGDEGDDTIFGGSGDDRIIGGKGDDRIIGGKGDDIIFGDDGADSIEGNDGADRIDGGAGNDFIKGGAGDDHVTGGAGNDILKGDSGADTFVIRDGHGSDTITDFKVSDDRVAFDMDEIGSFSDVQDRLTADGKDSLITFDNGSVLRMKGVKIGDLSPANFIYDAGPICLATGTLIDTPDGARPVETLRPGDMVETLDHGPLPILVVTCDRMRFLAREDRAKPILIGAGALTPGAAPLIVSPQHRILLTDPATGAEVLVPAVKLLGRPGIRRMRGRSAATCWNLLLASHEIIRANGCAAETMLLTPLTLARPDGVRHLPGPLALPMVPARPIRRHDPGGDPPVRRVVPVQMPARAAMNLNASPVRSVPPMLAQGRCSQPINRIRPARGAQWV